MDQPLEDLRSFIAYRIQRGFESVHEIIEDANNYANEKHERDDLLPEIKRIARELVATHQAEEAGWDGPTDCDRLDEAFAALIRQGIVARQDFSCCNNCGFTEIWDEIEKEEQDHPVEGYVFYHLQCTERAIETGQLLMAYGSIEEGEWLLAGVANKVVAELRRAGLNASWGGSDGHPIVADGIVWRRRRP
jgi:uncharacterized protein DUF6891